MIPLFRKMRHRLIEDYKFSKYLLYAIGEIILVVIGILIALQINNWNEHRKLQKEEVQFLLEMRSNLEVTLNNFKNDTLYNLSTIGEFEKIERYITEDLPYNNELDKSFSRLRNWASPYPIYTAYSTLKTKGLDIISNESLRSKIVNMYENELTILSTDYDKGEWGLMQMVVAPFYSQHIGTYIENSMTFGRPNDFESLKQNDAFKNILGMVISIRYQGLRYYKQTMIAIEGLIASIDTELMSRS
jgi:sensor domain CHASE-containing protein